MFPRRRIDFIRDTRILIANIILRNFDLILHFDKQNIRFRFSILRVLIKRIFNFKAIHLYAFSIDSKFCVFIIVI